MRMLPPYAEVCSVAVGDTSVVRSPDGGFDVPEMYVGVLEAQGWTPAPEAAPEPVIVPVIEPKGAETDVAGTQPLPDLEITIHAIADKVDLTPLGTGAQEDPREDEVRQAVADGMDEAEARAIVFGDPAPDAKD